MVNGGKSECGTLSLHRAPLVVPVDVPPVENGAVLTLGSTIVEVGAYSQLKKKTSRVIDHEETVLVPGLVNCHTHLELSFLQELGQDNEFFSPGDITSWIYALLHKRAECAGEPQKNMDQARLALEKMCQSGVVVNADIGNTGESAAISDNYPVLGFFFLEAFGLSESEVPAVEARLSAFENMAWTGHALYSTHSALVQRLKKRSKNRGDVFPIHIAESADEIEFLRTGKGAFADFLNRRFGETDPENAHEIREIFSPPGKGAVAHLADLGCLDSKTLCVHCVHVGDAEIDLLAGSGAGVCLCSGSNEYLGVGKAPVGKLLEKGIKPCMGTDSLASNPHLSLWNEMKILADLNMELEPEEIFSMATINGAQALGVDGGYGTLSPGKKAVMLAVKGAGVRKNGVFDRLVHLGVNPEIGIVPGCHD